MDRSKPRRDTKTNDKEVVMMSAVKPFYLTKLSKCPKCGGSNLEHLKTSLLGANFDCRDCGQRYDFSDYITSSFNHMDKKPFMQIFERAYYEVNKPR